MSEIISFKLTDILPKKILARDYLKSLEQMQEEDEEADFWTDFWVNVLSLRLYLRQMLNAVHLGGGGDGSRHTWTFLTAFERTNTFHM